MEKELNYATKELTLLFKNKEIKKINAFYINKEHDCFIFETDERIYLFTVDDQCCNTADVYHISGIDAFFGIDCWYASGRLD